MKVGLVFFRSKSFISRLIRCYTKSYGSNWSHVGIIFQKNVLKNLNFCNPSGKYVVFESVVPLKNDNIRNVDGSVFFGCQLRSFERLCKLYNKKGSISIIWLPNDINEMFLRNFIITYDKIPYERNVLNLLAIDQPFFYKNRSKFCSELVCIFLKNIYQICDFCKNISPNRLYNMFKYLGVQTIV